MEGQEQALYTAAEAAAEWGISIQAVYKRFNKLKQQGLIGLKDGKPCITRESLEAFKPVIKPGLNQVEQPGLKLNQQVESLTTSLNALKAELLAEQARASSLQAVIEAQQAHIDSLKRALDGEQALHMASLQKRLQAPGKGFFEGVKNFFSKKGEQ